MSANIMSAADFAERYMDKPVSAEERANIVRDRDLQVRADESAMAHASLAAIALATRRHARKQAIEGCIGIIRDRVYHHNALKLAALNANNAAEFEAWDRKENEATWCRLELQQYLEAEEAAPCPPAIS